MAYKINGVLVEDEAFEEEFESVKQHFLRLGETVCCDRDLEIRKIARENVIHRTLLEQESIRRFGPLEDHEVEQAYSQMVEDFGGLEDFLQKTGYEEADQPVIIARLRDRLSIDRLLDAEVQLPEKASDEALEEYYQAHIERFLAEEEICVSQILIEPRSHSVARETYDLMRGIRRQLLAGGDFDALAAEHGADQGRSIELGWMKPGETSPEIESILFSLQVGEISPVVASHHGFHLFMVTRKKEREPIPREKVEDLEAQYFTETRADVIEALLERLKSTSEIEEISSDPDPSVTDSVEIAEQ